MDVLRLLFPQRVHRVWNKAGEFPIMVLLKGNNQNSPEPLNKSISRRATAEPDAMTDPGCHSPCQPLERNRRGASMSV